jgi:hypothetical protein
MRELYKARGTITPCRRVRSQLGADRLVVIAEQSFDHSHGLRPCDVAVDADVASIDFDSDKRLVKGDAQTLGEIDNSVGRCPCGSDR